MADKNGREWSLDRKSHYITAQDYLDGFMEESKEELDTDESLSG